MVYQMVSRTDDETMRILNDVIILFVHANPDGNDLIADWYMRNPDPLQRSLSGLPRLYQKYIGHDNNRDFFASTQAETENMNRVLYREWFPQIIYNHHQSGPAGTVLWSPPLRDPFNYNQDPLLVLGIQTVGLALHTRLAAEGKPGATMRSGGPYDGWWNGGLRNTAAFHNMVAILTEMIGSPTPMRVPLVMDRQIPSSDLTFPVPPQEWHFRQSVDYSIACNRGILDIASRMKENFLFNIYRMGRNSIERGSRDTWTPRPHRYAAIAASMDRRADVREAGAGAEAPDLPRKSRYGPHCTVRRIAIRADSSCRRIRRISRRPPDSSTRCSKTALPSSAPRAISRCRRKSYPAGSFVVMTAQAFRPHVIDMFEPQDHPDNFPYSGAPPTPPYDNAGWTLAFQMGVEFDRILEGFSGPFENIPDWNIKAPASNRRPGKMPRFMSPARKSSTPLPQSTACWRQTRRCFVRRDGSFVISARSLPMMEQLAAERGVRFSALGGSSTAPRGSTEIDQTARRPVGPVRRVHRCGLGTLDSRTIRISVRARIRAPAGRGQPEWEVRHADLCRGHSRERRCARRRVRGSHGNRRYSRRISRTDGQRQRRAHASRDPSVHREWWHGRRHRNFCGKPGAVSRPATRKPPGGKRPAAAAHEVLCARLSPERESG